MSDTEAGRGQKMVPAPIPEELFVLGYTVNQGSDIQLAVYICLMDGCFVPDQGRKMHRKWHEGLARMIRDAGAAS